MPSPQTSVSSKISSLPARFTQTADHNGLRIRVTATRRITGVTVVTTAISGGPDHLFRDFYTLSQEPDAAQACRAAIDAVRRLLDVQSANGSREVAA